MQYNEYIIFPDEIYRHFTSLDEIKAIFNKNEYTCILFISLSRTTTGHVDALHQPASCFVHQPAQAISHVTLVKVDIQCTMFSFKGACAFEEEEFLYHYAQMKHCQPETNVRLKKNCNIVAKLWPIRLTAVSNTKI